jgi:hypothetical protein
MARGYICTCNEIWGMAAVRSYPSDVEDDEWDFMASYLCLMRENAP